MVPASDSTAKFAVGTTQLAPCLSHSGLNLLVPSPEIEAHNLEVKTSLLPNAGLGLFALRDFSAGEVVCVYSGTVYSLKESQQLIDKDYVVFVSLNIHVDARNHPAVRARYANHNFDPTKVNGKLHRQPALRRALIVATHDISKGEEIYIDYGKAYWARKGVQNSTLPVVVVDTPGPQ